MGGCFSTSCPRVLPVLTMCGCLSFACGHHPPFPRGLSRADVSFKTDKRVLLRTNVSSSWGQTCPLVYRNVLYRADVLQRADVFFAESFRPLTSRAGMTYGYSCVDPRVTFTTNNLRGSRGRGVNSGNNSITYSDRVLTFVNEGPCPCNGDITQRRGSGKNVWLCRGLNNVIRETILR